MSTVPVVGVFNGCQYTDPTIGEQVLATTTRSIDGSDIIAFVIDDPMTVFEVQADAAFPVADLFGNFDIVDQAHWDHSFWRSMCELEVTTGATATTCR